jgi:hypothetical protein
MVYSHASLPVYTFLNDYIEKVDSSLDFQVWRLLYPDAKKKEEMEYLPECKAVGYQKLSWSQEELLEEYQHPWWPGV